MAQINLPRPIDGSTDWAPVADALLDALKAESNSQDTRIASAEADISSIKTIISTGGGGGGGGGDGGASIYFNVQTYGAVGNGSTDDTAAINAAKVDAEKAASTAVFGTAASILYFPAGRYIYNGNIVVSAARMVLQGDGANMSILYRGSSGTGDIITFDADFSGMRSMGINGGNVGGSGDLVVLSAPYTFLDNFYLANGAQNAISIGKGSGAIEAFLNHGILRYCKSYGVQVVSGSGSTDGNWSNLDIGNMGLSGIRISNGSQNLTNIHVWGSGILSTTDTHGFWLDSDRNNLSNCQAETNRGDGYHMNGKGNNLGGGSSWGNRLAGVYGQSAPNTTVNGMEIYRNGIANSAGTSSISFAGILNDGSNSWSISGNNCWDDGGSVPDGTYSGGFTPTNPYVGRASGTTSQTYGYAEGSGANFCTVTGNSMRKEQTRTGLAVLTVGNDEVWSGNNLGAITVPMNNAQATVFPKPYLDIMKITGTATLETIYTTLPGRRMTLIFPDASPGRVANAATTGNLQLAGGVDWTPTTNDSITFISDGTNWYETSRSAN